MVCNIYEKIVPESPGKWQWSQQIIADQYQNRSRNGSGRACEVEEAHVMLHEMVQEGRSEGGAYLLVAIWAVIKCNLVEGLSVRELRKSNGGG